MADDQRDTFKLAESGRTKLAALGIDITPSDERRAGWEVSAFEPCPRCEARAECRRQKRCCDPLDAR